MSRPHDVPGNVGAVDLATTLNSWRRFVEGLPADAPVRPVILDSWRRSAAAGVTPTPAEIQLTRVPEVDLERRLRENSDLLTVSAPHLRWISTTLAKVPHVVYLVDRYGIVLQSTGTFAQMHALGLIPGYDWSEARMGTNGAGTALAVDQPVAVVGSEHFVDGFHNCTCTGAPVHDPAGKLIGAVDITTRAADGEPERVVLAAYLAHVIEHELAILLQQRDADAKLQEANRRLEEELRRRARLLGLLSEVSAVVDEADSLERTREKVLKLVARCLGWPVAHFYVRDAATSRLEDAGVWYLETPDTFTELARVVCHARFAPEEGPVARANASGDVCWMVDVHRREWYLRATGGRETGVRTVLAIPVLVRGKAVAVMEFFHGERLPPDPETLRVLAQVGVHFSRMFERRQLQQQILEATWRQQRAFGQELHDLAAQELAALGIQADRLTRRLDHGAHRGRELAAGLATGIRETLARVRALAHGLFPVEVDAHAFAAALERLATRTRKLHGIECELRCSGDIVLDDNNMAIQLFRIAQEAVANAVRHARATRIVIHLVQQPNRLRVAIDDNGLGSPPLAIRTGLGLHIMRYRASLIGASLDIEAVPRRGTVVTCTVASCPNDDRV